MRKFRIKLAAVLAVAATAFAAAPATAGVGTPEQDSSAYRHAVANCLKYTGCHGIKLSWAIRYSAYNRYTYLFYTTYYGARCYQVSVYPWGGAFDGHGYDC